MTKQEIEKTVADMLSAVPADFDALDKFIAEHADEYDGYDDEEDEEYEDDEEYYDYDPDRELTKYVFKLAVKTGNTDYVRNHVDYFNMEESSYLDYTDDEEMRDILISNGAMPEWDQYRKCRFAIETVNWSVIAFRPEFQREMYETFKKSRNLTDEDIHAILQDMNWEENEYDWLPQIDECDLAVNDAHNVQGWDVMRIMRTIGVYFKDGVLTFIDPEKYYSGDDHHCLIDLLDALGYKRKFEGHCDMGVIFIR